MRINHTIGAVYDKDSKVLILGTMPSVKSRENNFYYAHPRNRFWKTLEKVFNEKIGDNIEDKKDFLYRHNIALFDVLKSCDITGSSDSSIKNPIPNDLSDIISNSKINTIFTTGKKAYNLYMKLIFPTTLIPAIYLPSTSPANSPYGIDELLIKEYSKIRIECEKDN